jgi:hypothetical protein
MLAAFEQVKATLRLEDIELTPEQAALVLRHGRGELSDEQFRDEALALLRRRTRPKA